MAGAFGLVRLLALDRQNRLALIVCVAWRSIVANTTRTVSRKAVKIAARQRVDLRFNLYNVTNINTVRSVTERSGPSFNRPTAIVAPRIAEFSVGYSF